MKNCLSHCLTLADVSVMCSVRLLSVICAKCEAQRAFADHI